MDAFIDGLVSTVTADIEKRTGYGFKRSLQRVLNHEGGFSDIKEDRGGATNYGITQRTAILHKHLWEKHKFDGDMRKLPLSLAMEIYKVSYWDRIKGDQLLAIHPLLADHLFDFYVNAGGTAVKHLQRALNLLNNRQVDYKDVGVDGALGIGTLNSLRAFARKRGKVGLNTLVLTLVAMQTAFYLKISEHDPSQEKFTNGWINRTALKTRSYVNYLNE